MNNENSTGHQELARNPVIPGEMDGLDPVDRGGRENLIPVHGGYRKLKSFQVAQLVYDVTVRFCDRYIDRHKPYA